MERYHYGLAFQRWSISPMSLALRWMWTVLRGGEHQHERDWGQTIRPGGKPRGAFVVITTQPPSDRRRPTPHRLEHLLQGQMGRVSWETLG